MLVSSHLLSYRLDDAGRGRTAPTLTTTRLSPPTSACTSTPWLGFSRGHGATGSSGASPSVSTRRPRELSVPPLCTSRLPVCPRRNFSLGSSNGLCLTAQRSSLSVGRRPRRLLLGLRCPRPNLRPQRDDSSRGRGDAGAALGWRRGDRGAGVPRRPPRCEHEALAG